MGFMTEEEAPDRRDVARWVRDVRGIQPTTKFVLMLLFEHAAPQPDGTFSTWASYRKLAAEACFAEAGGINTVRRNVKVLEDAGLVRRSTRQRPDGSQTSNYVSLLVAPVMEEGGPPSPERGGPPSPGRGPTESPSGSPKPSPSSGGGGAPNLRPDMLPDSFPEDLKPHARIVLRTLREVAGEQPGAHAVTVKSLGLMMMGRPMKPFVKAVHDWAAWTAKPSTRPIKDVVASYRNWVDREPDLARREILPGDGTDGPPPRRHYDD